MSNQENKKLDNQFEQAAFDERSGRALGTAFWRLVEHYRFTQKEQAVLLGIKYNRERLQSLCDKQEIPFDPDKFLRVGNLLGIHKNLRIIYPHNRDIVYGWMKTPREEFHGKSAMDFISEDFGASLLRIFTVRRMLDQIRCGY
jgi:hypothetical protein